MLPLGYGVSRAGEQIAVDYTLEHLGKCPLNWTHQNISIKHIDKVHSYHHVSDTSSSYNFTRHVDLSN